MEGKDTCRLICSNRKSSFPERILRYILTGSCGGEIASWLRSWLLEDEYKILTYNPVTSQQRDIDDFKLKR